MGRTKKRRLAVETLERRDAPSASPAGNQFIVNATTLGNHISPAVAMDFRGDFVVAWTSYSQDGDGDGVYAQRYATDGTRLGSEFRVNSVTIGDQDLPAVAMDAAGDFVVVWTSSPIFQSTVPGQDGDSGGVYGQRYDAAGHPQGPEFRVNTFTTAFQGVPAVAMDALGDFVVAWDSSGQDGSGYGVYAQAYNVGGVVQGTEFRVNSFTTGNQTSPDIAMDYAGDFVITWQSYGQDGSNWGIYAQRYNAAGALQGGEFPVNTFTTGGQITASVGMDAAGDFAIAWTSYAEQEGTGMGSGDWVQRYSAAGVPLDAETNVATVTAGDQEAPHVARSANADSVIAFESDPPGGDGDMEGTFVRTFSSAGAFAPSQVQVNTYTSGVQELPAIAMDASGDFVVAWRGAGLDAFNNIVGSGIFAQRYHESNDTAGPLVTGVYTPLSTQPLAESGRLVAPVSSLTVVFSEDMNQVGGTTGANSVTNPANWVFTRDGNSITSQITGITFGFNITTRRYEATLTLAAPLIDQRNYTLKPGANLRDLAGNAIDGDYNGTPGGTYSLDFFVFMPGPVGPEFRVNTTNGPTFSLVQRSTVAADPNGDYVVAWRGSSTNFQYGVYAQVYTPAGQPRGPELTVAVDGGGRPAVAMDADGNFVIVYTRSSVTGYFAQRFTLDGASIGSQFQVNVTSGASAGGVAVTYDGAGDMIFAYQTPGLNLGQTRVFARRFDATGAPLGAEFAVDPVTADNQASPTVAADAAGNFVIAWQSATADVDIYVRRYNAAGEPQGPFYSQVNTFVTGNQTRPSVAMDAAGNFVIAWASTNEAGAGSGSDVIARRFDSAGAVQGGEFVVNTFTTNSQALQSVSADRTGDFVVAWQSSQEGTNGDVGIYAQRYSGTGNRLGGELHVNTFTTSDQTFPSVAMDGDGDFVVTWESLQGASNFNVMAQRFSVAPPQVTAVQVNNTLTDPQRSRVTSIRLIYSTLVNYASSLPAAFVLTRQSDGVPVTFSAQAGSNNGVGVVTLLNFSGPATDNGSLADGRYTLRVLASQVSNLGGALDGNGDFIGGDDYVLVGSPANGLFRLFGDADGNGVVNNADFLAFRSAFGGNASMFDFDNNGSVGTSDFLAFRSRFGSSV